MYSGNAYDRTASMNEGEKELYSKCLRLESDGFRLIPDALFQRVGEGTNQIDLIVISKKGIFVIEMKDFNGWVFGDENREHWTQSLRGGRGRAKKYKFRNPVKQNENHIKTVRHILSRNGFNDLPIYNVVVFGVNAVLKDITASVDLVSLPEIYGVFNKYRDVDITEIDIGRVYDYLENENIKDPQAREAHLRYVKSLSAESSRTAWNPLPRRALPAEFGPQTQKSKWTLGKWAVAICVLALLSGSFQSRPPASPPTTSSQPGYSQQAGSNMSNNNQATSTGAAQQGNPVVPPVTQTKPPITVQEKPVVSSSTQNNPTVPSSTNQQSGTFHLGYSEDEVTRALGQPQRTEDVNGGSKWYYGIGYVSFNTDGHVNGWSNFNGVLNAGMLRREDNALPIEVGATKNDVLSALGSPGFISSQSPNEWSYGVGYVRFSNTGLVNGWSNFNGVLNTGLRRREDNALPIDIGATKDDVLSALGSPGFISSQSPNEWSYGVGYVRFNSDALVNGWYNYNGVLNSGMRVREENAEVIQKGSTKEDVIKALGSPSRIDSSNLRKWSYGLAYVSFDSQGLVSDWKNYNNILTGKVLEP